MKFGKKALYSMAVIGATLLAACGSGAATDSSGQNANGEDTITLKIMTWNNNPEGTKKEQEILDAFTKEHPNVKIEQISATYAEYNERVLTMAAGGNLPDLLWVQPSGFGGFVENGLLTDLTDKVAALDTEEFQPGVLELGQVDGAQYAMTRDRSTVQIGYNKDMFDEAGIPYPEDDWTMDEFLEISKKLTVKEGERTVQFGIENFYLKELLTAYGTSMLAAIRPGKSRTRTDSALYLTTFWNASAGVYTGSGSISTACSRSSGIFSSRILSCIAKHNSLSVIAAYCGDAAARPGIASIARASSSNRRLNSRRLSIMLPHLPLAVPTENRISTL